MTELEKWNALKDTCSACRYQYLDEKKYPCCDCFGTCISYSDDFASRSFRFVSEDELEDVNPYWQNICKIADMQRHKGMQTYGQGIEGNPAGILTRIHYLEEELVDALMYCEWIKDYLTRKEDDLK